MDSTPGNMPSASPDLAGCRTTELSVCQLVGEVYASAPAYERSRLVAMRVQRASARHLSDAGTAHDPDLEPPR